METLKHPWGLVHRQAGQAAPYGTSPITSSTSLTGLTIPPWVRRSFGLRVGPSVCHFQKPRQY